MSPRPKAALAARTRSWFGCVIGPPSGQPAASIVIVDQQVVKAARRVSVRWLTNQDCAAGDSPDWTSHGSAFTTRRPRRTVVVMGADVIAVITGAQLENRANTK